MSGFKIRPSQMTQVVALTGLIVTGVLTSSFYFWTSTIQQQRWLRHTYQVLSADHNLLADVRDAETGQRGYLLTGDPLYLGPYERGSKTAPVDFETLRLLTLDDARQQQTVKLLLPPMTVKLNELAKTISVADADNVAAALAIVKSGVGRKAMETVRTLTAIIAEQEERGLLARTATRSRDLRIAIVSSIAFVLLAIILARKLLAAYRHIRSVSECSSDSIMSISFDWKLLYGNAKAAKGLRDFKLDSSFWECFPGLRSTPAEKLLRTAMRDRVSVSYEDFYAPYQRWFQVDGFPSDEGLSLFFNDITESKSVREQLAGEKLRREVRVEALSHMAGGLAHEIGNPLAIIQARAEDLMSQSAGEKPIAAQDVYRTCDSIVIAARRAGRMLAGMHGFAHEPSRSPMETIAINTIIRECVALQEARFASVHLDLRLILQQGDRDVHCRTTQIGQVVTNLLQNAFEAVVQSSASERWVSVTAGGNTDTVWIDVIDSGPGIDDMFRDHIMEPFFTTKQVGGGMGIGLSLSRAIAHEHGGTLVLRPDVAHTCFRLSLPV
jgi:C4-dicarboxylate-specific signal transduction histidine kinase